MKIPKLFLAAMAAWTVSTAAWADGPFRLHRYDAFKALPPVTEGTQTVFFGNSITNMHEWWEGFGSDSTICNRGNSGGFAYELIENVESFLESKPQKVFIGIGTNDLNSGKTPKETVLNIRTLVRRIHIASPNTKIYVQSILPRSNGGILNIVKDTDELLKAFCEEEGSNATYVDLYDTMMGLYNNTGGSATSWTVDGLHPTGIAYRAWVNAIKDLVNNTSAYQDGNNVWGGMGSAHAMRCSQFGLLPVSEDDVVIFGDEMIHGGEWHELLASSKVKGRGTGWGYGGITLANAAQMVKTSLTNNTAQHAPKEIFLYYGVTESNSANTEDLQTTFKNNYLALLDTARHCAPSAPIYIMSLLPTSGTMSNVTACNTLLKALADSLENVSYIDICTPFCNEDGTQNTTYFSSNYLYANGYVKLARILSEYIPGTKVPDDDTFNTYYNNRTLRNNIGIQLNKLLKIEVGDQPGMIPAANAGDLNKAIDDISQLLSNNTTVTEEMLTTATTTATTAYNNACPYYNLPTASTDTEEHWYRLTSKRGTKSAAAQSDSTVQGSAIAYNAICTGEDLWKFVKRDDGTYDIINNRYGTYLTPTSTSNGAITALSARPEKGWTISYNSAVPGYYTIYYSKTAQFHQSNSAAVINYGLNTSSDEPNRTDEGCLYTAEEYTGTIYDADKAVTTGWYTIDAASGLTSLISGNTHHVQNADEEYRQNATNSYALSFGAAPDSDSEAKAFIHVNVNGSSLTTTALQYTALNGHGINENCTSNRTSVITSGNPVTTNVDFDKMEFTIGKWSTYQPVSGGTVYVGKSSASNNTYTFTRVSDETLDKYDIWAVSIQNATAASQAYYDTKVTLKDVPNAGIATVYDGGTYFLPKGTQLTTDNIVVTPVDGVTATPYISIYPDEKTILVDYAPLVGWYTIDFVTADGNSTVTSSQSSVISPLVEAGTQHVLNADEEFKQKSGYWYPLCIGTTPTEAPAKAFLYISRASSAANDYAITALNGHGINQYACASRDFIAADHLGLTATNDVYNLPYWAVWSGSGGSQDPYVGRFSSATNYFSITAADTTAYDIYHVVIEGQTYASEVGEDLLVTLTNAANKGLSKVYHGGSFFVTKGTTLTPEMITAPAHNGVTTPLITIDGNTITVDYTEKATAIGSLPTVEAPAANGCYDLSGRRLNGTPVAGLYIINGRKTVVR
jgi:lysophospholipase L1-like esterase